MYLHIVWGAPAYNKHDKVDSWGKKKLFTIHVSSTIYTTAYKVLARLCIQNYPTLLRCSRNISTYNKIKLGTQWLLHTITTIYQYMHAFFLL